MIALAAWTGNPNIMKALIDKDKSESVDWKTPPTSDEDMPFYCPAALGMAGANGVVLDLDAHYR